jgi:hypothetical protein
MVTWFGRGVLQTEKFYDLLGSASFLTLAIGSLVACGSFAPQQVRHSLSLFSLVRRNPQSGAPSGFCA